MKNNIVLSTRDISIDVVGSILIINMMLLHLCAMYESTTTISSYWPFEYLQFFMSWFYFKSGMFAKQSEVSVCVKKNAKKLLKTFIVFSILGYFVELCQFMFDHDTDWRHYVLSPFKEILIIGSVRGNAPLWFLLSLFGVQCLFQIFAKHRISLYIIAMLSLLIAFICSEYHYLNFLCLDTIFVGLFFYILGFEAKKCQYGLVTFLIGLTILCSLMMFTTLCIDLHFNKFGDGTQYFIGILFCMSSIVVVNNIFKYLSKHIKYTFLQYIGKHSMAYYVLHFPCFILIGLLLKQLNIFDYIPLQTQIIAISFPLLFILEHFFYDKIIKFI